MSKAWQIFISIVLCYVILSTLFGAIKAQSEDPILFTSTEGHLLTNQTSYMPGYVLFDAVPYGDRTHITLDFSLPTSAESLKYSHYSGWTSNGYIWSEMELTNLPAGRQQHTLPLGTEIDQTIGCYFNLPGVTLYSAKLTSGAPSPEPDPDPLPDDECLVLVDGDTIQLQRQVGREWLGAEEICGKIQYRDNVNGCIYVLDFGECD